MWVSISWTSRSSRVTASIRVAFSTREYTRNLPIGFNTLTADRSMMNTYSRLSLKVNWVERVTTAQATRIYSNISSYSAKGWSPADTARRNSTKYFTVYRNKTGKPKRRGKKAIRSAFNWLTRSLRMRQLWSKLAYAKIGAYFPRTTPSENGSGIDHRYFGRGTKTCWNGLFGLASNKRQPLRLAIVCPYHPPPPITALHVAHLQSVRIGQNDWYGAFGIHQLKSSFSSTSAHTNKK